MCNMFVCVNVLYSIYASLHLHLCPSTEYVHCMSEGKPDHAFAVVLIFTIHVVTCMFWEQAV